MSEVVAKAFLSYAHVDNEREDGRIRRLAHLIRSEFEFLTGETIDIFVDSAEIRWGQDFRNRLDEAMQNTTFFIPVLTPTYFLREECRKEMLQFVSSARSLGLQELLMSIRYTAVPDLREGSTDELKDIAARMQFESWDDVRLLDEASSAYRTRINRLAARLVELTRDLEERPLDLGSRSKQDAIDIIASHNLVDGRPSAESRLDNPQTESQVEDEDPPGFLEHLAEFQPVADEWTKSLTTLGPAVAEFGELFSTSSEKMNAANTKPNPFAAKIVLARKLAKDAAAPLEMIEQTSKEYSTNLLRMDPIIRAVLEITTSQEADGERAVAVTAIQRLIDSSREAMDSISGAADAAKANAGLSRDLRPILRRFETALRNVVDGQDLIESWEPLLERAGSPVFPSLEIVR